MAFLEPQPLQQQDLVADFDCGDQELNRFLQRHAFQSQQSQGAKTYVTLSDYGKVAGYYTLAYGSVEYEAAPARAKKGLAKHPVPVMVLARLAVAGEFRGLGLGKGLLRDALLRTLQAAGIAGLRAVVVHAKNEEAKSFYEHYGFEAFPSDPLKLFLLLKDLRSLIAG